VRTPYARAKQVMTESLFLLHLVVSESKLLYCMSFNYATLFAERKEMRKRKNENKASFSFSKVIQFKSEQIIEEMNIFCLQTDFSAFRLFDQFHDSVIDGRGHAVFRAISAYDAIDGVHLACFTCFQIL